jgi:hypothetical protein
MQPDRDRMHAETTMPTQITQKKTAPRLTHAIAQLIAGLRRDLFGGYRPELHYMRGPGPKWHARHA